VPLSPRSTCHVWKQSSVYHRTAPVTRGLRAHLLLLRGEREEGKAKGAEIDVRDETDLGGALCSLR